MTGGAHVAERAGDGAPGSVSLPQRMAICTCRRTVPSDPSLAFFEFTGEGSPRARTSCKHCGYHEVAHTTEGMARNVASNRKTVIEDGRCPGPFEPRGAFEFDFYYCGCRGWD